MFTGLYKEYEEDIKECTLILGGWIAIVMVIWAAFTGATYAHEVQNWTTMPGLANQFKYQVDQASFRVGTDGKFYFLAKMDYQAKRIIHGKAAGVAYLKHQFDCKAQALYVDYRTVYSVKGVLIDQGNYKKPYFISKFNELGILGDQLFAFCHMAKAPTTSGRI